MGVPSLFRNPQIENIYGSLGLTTAVFAKQNRVNVGLSFWNEMLLFFSPSGRPEVIDGRICPTDSGWHLTDGRWHSTDGGWRLTDGGWRLTDTDFPMTNRNYAPAGALWRFGSGSIFSLS